MNCHKVYKTLRARRMVSIIYVLDAIIILQIRKWRLREV